MRLIILLLPLILFAQQAFNVKTTQVSQKLLAEHKEYPAILKFDERFMIDVVPRFGGYVEHLYADRLFQSVRQGEPLLKAYSPEVYKAKLELLHSYNYKDPAMIRAAKTKLKLYDIASKEILSVIKKRKHLTYTTIFAPISGVIYRKSIYTGSSFKSGELLYQIVDPTKVKAVISYPQNDRSFIQKAESFQIQIGNHIYRSKYVLYHPVIDQKTLYAQASVYFQSSIPIEDGEYAKVKVTHKKRLYTVIPKSAAIKRAEGWYIFVKNDFDEFEPKKVELRPLNSQYFELVSPIEINTTIANYPMFLLDSDAQINGMYDD